MSRLLVIAAVVGLAWVTDRLYGIETWVFPVAVTCLATAGALALEAISRYR